MPTAIERWTEQIAVDRAALGRVSTAERVADVLREHIIEGALRPGTRLSEEGLGGALGVSRNTLREAFRLLSHERLLVHEFNRGVFVRELTTDDVVDLYRMRQILERSAVREAAGASGVILAPVRDAVEEGEEAAAAGRWLEVGTANMHFHQALTALAGSARLDEVMRRLMAEGRLAFHAMKSLQEFHEPYLVRNREILEMLKRGATDKAERELGDYLDTAERHLLEGFRRRATKEPDPGPRVAARHRSDG